MPVDFDFEGIGVWYICHRNGDTFHLRHILVEISGGRFRRGQVNQFEGYWDEFPQFVAEDRWVKALLTQRLPRAARSEEHTSELQSLMRISYAVFCLKKKTYTNNTYIKSQSTQDRI